MKVAATLFLTVCMVATAAMQTKPTNYKGLEVTPLSIERAKNVALIDCPPGMNSVRGNARGEEEFVVVTFGFKVTPSFDAKTIVERRSGSVAFDTSRPGTSHQTSTSIVDR